MFGKEVTKGLIEKDCLAELAVMSCRVSWEC